MENSQQRKRKIRVRWTPEAEKMLLQYWADNIGDLRAAKKNVHIFAHIGAEFAKRQMSYSAGEIKEKIHNFTNRYKLEKKQMGSTGGSPSTWVHYKEVEAILSGSKAINFDGVMEDSIDYNKASTSSPSVSSSPIDELGRSSSTPAKRKKVTYEYVIESIEQTSTMLKDEMAEMKEIQKKVVDLTEKAVLAEERRNQILEDMNNNTKNFYNELINFLKE